MKNLIVFDLDGTLAESKSAIDAEMASQLRDLLGIVRVAVISGGDWPQFEKQLIPALAVDADLKRLSLLPTCGTKFYEYETTWKKLYSENLTDSEKDAIVRSVHKAVDALDVGIEHTWGEQIEDRGSQITFSALGQRAPLDDKKRWDPDFKKRKQIKATLDALFRDYSVRLGGTTSVDITKKGVDKGYGIRKLRDVLGISIDEMIFIGDALFPGGNDYPAKEAGVVSIPVRNPAETQLVIAVIIACLQSGEQARSDGHDR